MILSGPNLSKIIRKRKKYKLILHKWCINCLFFIEKFIIFIVNIVENLHDNDLCCNTLNNLNYFSAGSHMFNWIKDISFSLRKIKQKSINETNFMCYEYLLFCFVSLLNFIVIVVMLLFVRSIEYLLVLSLLIPIYYSCHVSATH